MEVNFQNLSQEIEHFLLMDASVPHKRYSHQERKRKDFYEHEEKHEERYFSSKRHLILAGVGVGVMAFSVQTELQEATMTPPLPSPPQTLRITMIQGL